MRAAIFHGPGQPITVERFADPVCGPLDVVVAVRRCGICGSDISMTGEAIFTFAPGRIGHEYSGEVVEVGREVSNVRPGQRVACMPGTPCGECEGCRLGNSTFCLHPQRTIGNEGGFGGFAEFVALPAGGAVVLPEGMSFAEGALVEPMACGVHALRLARMPQGARILVIGGGSMALAIIYWARLLGAPLGRRAVAALPERIASARRRAAGFDEALRQYGAFMLDGHIIFMVNESFYQPEAINTAYCAVQCGDDRS